MLTINPGVEGVGGDLPGAASRSRISSVVLEAIDVPAADVGERALGAEVRERRAGRRRQNTIGDRRRARAQPLRRRIAASPHLRRT